MAYHTKNLGMLALAIVVSAVCIVGGAYFAAWFAEDRDTPEVREIAAEDDERQEERNAEPDRRRRLSNFPPGAPAHALEELTARQDEQRERRRRREPREKSAREDEEPAQEDRQERREQKLRVAERLGEGVGPARWMAEPDDVDVAQLERELDRGEMDQEFELSRRADRRRSIEVAEEEVDRCYKSWTTRTEQSRVALEWTMITEAGQGTIVDPQITTWLGPESAEFERCVVDALSDLTFDAEGDGAELDVQWAAQSR